MTDWRSILHALAPQGKVTILEGLADAMPGLIDEFEINTRLRLVHFLAQCAHESDGFRTLTEYASGKEYEGRTDLGNTHAGDGVKFKGRAVLQLTGEENYAKAGADLGLDLLGNPHLAEEFPAAARISGWFWKTHGINRFADADDVFRVSARINGINRKTKQPNGLAERKAWLAKAKRLLLPDAPAEFVVKAIQQRLRELGYHEVGMPDGAAGSKTTGAIAAFQRDNNLPVTGVVDAATRDAMASATPRVVAPAREEGQPENSRILEGANRIIKGSVIAGTTIGVDSLPDLLDKAEAAKGVAERIRDLIEPFKGFMVDHWKLAVLGIGALLLLEVLHIRKARIEDHQTGKTA